MGHPFKKFLDELRKQFDRAAEEKDTEQQLKLLETAMMIARCVIVMLGGDVQAGQKARMAVSRSVDMADLAMKSLKRAKGSQPSGCFAAGGVSKAVNSVGTLTCFLEDTAQKWPLVLWDDLLIVYGVGD